MRILDLFCGAGGAAMGYHRAGFEVVGVDIHPQPRYPFEFHQGDALDYLREHGHEFDARHASPPCQAYSITHHSHGREHPDLIAPVRSLLLRIGGAWVIENVPGAPLLDPVTLCWSMFHQPTDDDDGTPLRMERHRLFESSVPLTQPEHPRHDRGVKCAGAYGGGRSQRKDGRGGYTPSMDARRRLMGMPWASGAEVGQAIPPAYAEWIGLHLRAHLLTRHATDARRALDRDPRRTGDTLPFWTRTEAEGDQDRHAEVCPGRKGGLS